MALCEVSDLYAYGISRGAIPNPGRVIHELSDSVFTLDQHGFELNRPISFRSVCGTLPPEIVEGVEYYALPTSASMFQVQILEDSGPNIITDSSDTIMVITPLPLNQAIAWAAAIMYDMMPAHAIPDSPTPSTVAPIVRYTCAELAAAKVLAVEGACADTLSKVIEVTMKRLERWAKGVPLRSDLAPAQTNLTVYSTKKGDPSGWSKYGGTL